MTLLIHCCCGPCAVSAAEHFRLSEMDVTGWFFNPNIHPPGEYSRRATTMAEAAERTALPMLPEGPAIGLAEFLLRLGRGGGRRCLSCYQLRLEATARKAAEQGFGAFSSTLLISPYQDLDAIADIGKKAGESEGVEFQFADLRTKYSDSCNRARQLDLYRQNYCGCVFSALERAARRARRAIGRRVDRGASQVSG